MWGDITLAEGDVYASGHYEGVLPQAGELALDRMVSGRDSDLVITAHTRRGMMRGAVGDINFFPWANSRKRRLPLQVWDIPVHSELLHCDALR